MAEASKVSLAASKNRKSKEIVTTTSRGAAKYSLVGTNGGYTGGSAKKQKRKNAVSRRKRVPRMTTSGMPPRKDFVPRGDAGATALS